MNVMLQRVNFVEYINRAKKCLKWTLSTIMRIIYVFITRHKLSFFKNKLPSEKFDAVWSRASVKWPSSVMEQNGITPSYNALNSFKIHIVVWGIKIIFLHRFSSLEKARQWDLEYIKTTYQPYWIWGSYSSDYEQQIIYYMWRRAVRSTRLHGLTSQKSAHTTTQLLI
jgi:hypothetical protein